MLDEQQAINKLNLDKAQVERCRTLSQQIVQKTCLEIDEFTTVSVERAAARLFGVDGVNAVDVPVPNDFVDRLKEEGVIDRGSAYWLAAGVMKTSESPQQVAEMIASGNLRIDSLETLDPATVRSRMDELAEQALKDLEVRQLGRRKRREKDLHRSAPLIYVLTATGNVYEDVSHAKAVAQHGGDIVAVIRSTAQSLLDYVPYGPTTEGFGGTYATQENFRIMRLALDEWSEKNGRYVRLSSFCSGLCMPEIAVMGAIEGLDNMVNDALYGILYRDINMVRTLIDQQFSRCVNGYFGVTINTGEDNYLRTADAMLAAPSVVASQLINVQLANASGLRKEQIAIGSAFEIHPDVKNGLLYEIAHAQLTREIFPGYPIKYMPPTKHMDGNLFRTHANDALFNLVTILTGQSIQTLGVPTEGIFTPHIHDRVIGLECARYVHNFAEGLGEEISFRTDGVIQARAHDVLSAAERILEGIARDGLFAAIGEGTFGNVKRCADGGKGLEGVIKKNERYHNPFFELMRSKHGRS